MDDIVIFSKTLEEHLLHLDMVFALLSDWNIGLSPAKTFLGYPSVPLLGQKVDAFGLSTAEEKLAAITKLRFPKTLKQLEKYIGLTGWLRNYVPYYAQLAEPLQLKKTNVSHHLPTTTTCPPLRVDAFRIHHPTY